MIQVRCSTTAEIDAVWRLLIHVPDADFLPCEVFLGETFRYRIVRRDGDQTTAPPADPPGCSSAAP